MSEVMDPVAPAATAKPKAAATATVAVARVGELLKLLQGPADAAERRTTMPILSNLLLEKAGTMLTVTATTLEHELTVHGTAGLVEGDARTTVNGHKLCEILRALPSDQTVKLSLDKAKLTVQCGAAKFRLNTLPAEDFPQMRQVEYPQTVTLPQGVLRRMLGAVQYCMNDEPIRQNLNGVLLEAEGNSVTAVTTDGHRLAHAAETVDSPLAARSSIIVPRKVVGILLKMLADTDAPVELKLGDRQATLLFSGMKLVTKLVEGSFPDYRRVVPKKFAAELAMERDTLAGPIQRARLVAVQDKHRRGRPATLTFKAGTLLIESGGSEESANEDVEIGYEGADLTIGFNLDYLTDAIENLPSSKFTLGLQDGNSSVLFRDCERATYYGIVMPCRV